jgi:hypothetical protein
MNHVSKRLALSAAVAIVATIGFLVRTSAASGDGLAAQVAALAAKVDALRTVVAMQEKQIAELRHGGEGLAKKLKCVSSISTDKDVIFDGCNVHVRNGAGQTDTTNGYGNLIIGYNKNEIATRTGSHNFIVGDLHEYQSYGGIVSGIENTLAVPNSTILSSGQSEARTLSSGVILAADRGITDTVAVILGGRQNYAGPTANFGVVIGGTQNTISGAAAVAVGGTLNEAAGGDALACGGSENHAQGSAATVCGGSSNTSNGLDSSISGGSHNTANGRASSVSGGWTNTADGDYSSILGGNTVSVSATYGTSP